MHKSCAKGEPESECPRNWSPRRELPQSAWLLGSEWIDLSVPDAIIDCYIEGFELKA